MTEETRLTPNWTENTIKNIQNNPESIVGSVILKNNEIESSGIDIVVSHPSSPTTRRTSSHSASNFFKTIPLSFIKQKQNENKTTITTTKKNLNIVKEKDNILTPSHVFSGLTVSEDLKSFEVDSVLVQGMFLSSKSLSSLGSLQQSNDGILGIVDLCLGAKLS